ncbi:MAG TPA: hypothetical protein VFD27_02850 [Chthoniobacteraceae bacterium]|nr:hypothetical protein [Chthoniobacteraceae bacterium]
MSTKTTHQLSAAILLAAATFAPLPAHAQAPTPVPPPTPAIQPPPVQPAIPPVGLGSDVLPLTQPRATPPAEPSPVSVASAEPRIDQPNVSGTSNYRLAPANQFRATGRTVLAPGPTRAPRADEIIREAKLKVLQHHYETAFAEFMEIEKALVTASSEERDTLTAKATALRGFAERLEGEIRKLGDNAAPTAATQPRKTGNYLRRSVRPIGGAGAFGSYTPAQATGAPDTDASRSDSPLAWCPESSSSDKEWLTLRYNHRVEIAEVRIHEAYATGALARVIAQLTDDNGRLLQEHLLWAETETPERPPVVRVITAPPGVMANGIRVELETARIQNWQEIDAVELVGRDGTRQWAEEAEASSYWGRERTSFSPAGTFGSGDLSRASALSGEGATSLAPSAAGEPSVLAAPGDAGGLGVGSSSLPTPDLSSRPK